MNFNGIYFLFPAVHTLPSPIRSFFFSFLFLAPTNGRLQTKILPHTQTKSNQKQMRFSEKEQNKHTHRMHSFVFEFQANNSGIVLQQFFIIAFCTSKFTTVYLRVCVCDVRIFLNVWCLQKQALYSIQSSCTQLITAKFCVFYHYIFERNEKRIVWN